MRWRSAISPTACAAARRSCSPGRGRNGCCRGPNGWNCSSCWPSAASIAAPRTGSSAARPGRPCAASRPRSARRRTDLPPPTCWSGCAGGEPDRAPHQRSEMHDILAVRSDQFGRRFLEDQSTGLKLDGLSRHDKFIELTWCGGMHAVGKKVCGSETNVGLGASGEEFLEGLGGYFCLVARRPIRISAKEFRKKHRPLVGLEHGKIVFLGFKQAEVERTNGLAHKFPHAQFLRSRCFRQSDIGIDFVIGHRRIKGRKRPSLSNQPVIQIYQLPVHRDLYVSDQPTKGIENVVWLVDLRENTTIKCRLSVFRQEIM